MDTLVHMLFGSWVYGTNVETSDKDYKQVFMPNARDIILGNTKDAFNHTTKQDLTAKNSAVDEEVEYFSLKKYMNLLLEGQTVAIDMLFTPEEFYIGPVAPAWRYVQDNKHLWLHSGILKFLGYARQQANKYGIRGSRVAASRAAVEFFTEMIKIYSAKTKLREVWPAIDVFNARGLEHVAIVNESMKNQPGKQYRMLEVCNRKVQEGTTLEEALKVFTRVFDEYGARALQAENNENVDWKATMHAIRIVSQAKELLLTGKITFPRPDAEYLLEVRRGLRPYAEVAKRIEDGMDELVIVQQESILPPEPNIAMKEEFLYQAYLEKILN